MKIPRCFTRRLEVSLLMCLFITSCNPNEFFQTLETIEGRDAYCSQATDVNMCQGHSDVCQPAYDDSEDETAGPVFSACIANPVIPPTEPTTPPTEPTTPPTEPTTPPTEPTTPPTEPTTPPTEPTIPPTEPTTPTTPPVVIVPPTLEEALQANCTNLDSEYLWIKTTTTKKGSSRVVKVKVCHTTGNLSQHTIIIACPALQAHINHQEEDSIGACKN
jgi:outer membrane biosynthesis protein TonB